MPRPIDPVYGLPAAAGSANGAPPLGAVTTALAENGEAAGMGTAVGAVDGNGLGFGELFELPQALNATAAQHNDATKKHWLIFT